MPDNSIETRSGDILAAADLEAIINPVNCRGVMGRGLAALFAIRYPQIVMPYRQACNTGLLSTETVFIQRVSRHQLPAYVVNLATKQDWRHPSRLEWIQTGLADMYRQLAELEVGSVGIPALGAGLGGLDWEQVLTVIKRHSADNPAIRTVVYLPR